MAPRQIRSLIAVPLLLASMAALSPAVARASAETESFVTMFRHDGDYPGKTWHSAYHAGNATITLNGTASYLWVSVRGGELGDDSYHFDISAPPGEVLQVGDYEGARRFAEDGRPGFDFGGNGFGCNQGTGRFRVNQITLGPTGVPTSLWVVYEYHCDGGPYALIGEIRVNIPGDGGSVDIGPREIRWPRTDPGSHFLHTVPFLVRNSAPTNVKIGASSISGPSASEFELRNDDCAGQTLAPGASCRVFVGWIPGQAGDKTATLLVPEVGGSTHELAMGGHVYSGRTRMTMISDEGDYIGGGKNWSHTTFDATFGAFGNDELVQAGSSSGYWESVGFLFAAPNGQVLTPGRTYHASRYPFNGAGAGMDISSTGKGCNTLTGNFTIHQLQFNAFDEVERMSASFEQHCEGGPAALRGTFDYRATTPEPEPWLETVIKSGPLGVVTDPNATFRFGATLDDSTFECSLDGSGFQPCTSPVSYQDLSEGSHAFRVRATFPGGSVDSSPAERQWVVDRFGPVISVLHPTAGVYVNDQSLGGTGQIVVIGSVTVQATATDAESGLSVGWFEVNGTPVAFSDITRDGDWFRFTFRPPTPGEHTITVRATNGSGLASSTTFSVVGVPAN
jgi:hypothetical protein